MFKRGILCTFAALTLSGCFSLPVRSNYQGPPTRPASIEQYYSKGGSYLSFDEVELEKTSQYTHKLITIETALGPTSVEYFQRAEPSKNLIFVFPMLGGKNGVERYFARYYANHGYETAIVNRNNDFKNPENIDRLEMILRQGVIRDRIAIDFFEKQYGKSEFGTFGISRGAINVAVSAGVDPRLKYNVIALGASDLAKILSESDASKIRAFRVNAAIRKKMTESQLFTFLQKEIQTDPKAVAKYIDAKNTLMFLSVFDSTVPFKYGEKLREEIGEPETIYLMAGHKGSVLYTGLLEAVSSNIFTRNFPPKYIEQEALGFYNRSFKGKRFEPGLLPYRILRAPLDLIGWIVNEVTK